MQYINGNPLPALDKHFSQLIKIQIIPFRTSTMWKCEDAKGHWVQTWNSHFHTSPPWAEEAALKDLCKHSSVITNNKGDIEAWCWNRISDIKLVNIQLYTFEDTQSFPASHTC